MKTERFILISYEDSYVKGAEKDGLITAEITDQRVQWTAEHEWNLIENDDGTYSIKNFKYGTYLKGDSTDNILA